MNVQQRTSTVLFFFSRNKTKAFLMMLAVIVAVASLYSILTIGDNIKVQMMEKMGRQFSSDSLLVVGGGAGVGNGIGADKLTIQDVDELIVNLDGVRAWDHRIEDGQKTFVYQGEEHQFELLGHSHQANVVWQRDVLEGEYFTEANIRRKAKVALIGNKAAKELFGEKSALGKRITIDQLSFVIQGVLEPMGVDPHGIDKDREIQIPYTTLAHMRKINYITAVKILAIDPDNVPVLAEKSAEFLRAKHNIGKDEPEDFTIITPTIIRAMIDEANKVYTVFLPIIAVVALLISVVVIANVMLVGVKERAVEIGLRKAIGARVSDIRKQFLLEACYISSLGGVIGILLGVACVAFVSNATGVDLPFSVTAFLISFFSALAIGTFAGFIPANNAARLNPVVALREGA